MDERDIGEIARDTHYSGDFQHKEEGKVDLLYAEKEREAQTSKKQNKYQVTVKFLLTMLDYSP